MNVYTTPIDTNRLTVRPFQMADLDAIHRILDADGGETLAARQAWLTWTVANLPQLHALYQPPYGERAVILRETDTLIGTVGLVQSYAPFETLPYFRARLNTPVNAGCTPEMGLYWHIDAAYRGNGYATEAAQALIDLMFQHFSLKRIVATTEDNNVPSQRVMARLGMTIEHNPHPEPHWFQVCGILENPKFVSENATS